MKTLLLTPLRAAQTPPSAAKSSAPARLSSAERRPLSTGESSGTTPLLASGLGPVSLALMALRGAPAANTSSQSSEANAGRAEGAVASVDATASDGEDEPIVVIDDEDSKPVSGSQAARWLREADGYPGSGASSGTGKKGGEKSILGLVGGDGSSSSRAPCLLRPSAAFTAERDEKRKQQQDRVSLQTWSPPRRSPRPRRESMETMETNSPCSAPRVSPQSPRSRSRSLGGASDDSEAQRRWRKEEALWREDEAAASARRQRSVVAAQQQRQHQ